MKTERAARSTGRGRRVGKNDDVNEDSSMTRNKHPKKSNKTRSTELADAQFHPRTVLTQFKVPFLCKARFKTRQCN